MNPLPVTARRLRHRAVQANDGVLPDVTFLPLFEASGNVRQVLLVSAAPAQVSLLDWSPGLVRVPVFGPIQLSQAAAALRPASDLQLSLSGTLWHFDRDWLLDQERFARGDAYQALRAGNCTDRWSEPVRMLWFRRDLSRVVLVGVRRNGGVELKGWSDRFLPKDRPHPKMPPRRPGAGARGGWVLEPIWHA